MTPPPAAHGRGATGFAVAVGLGAVALTALYLVHARVHGAWQVDDAGITFAYARNIAAGHGAVTNPGDAALNEGYSNPAWTALLALFMVAGAFDLVVTPKVLSVVATVATFAVMAGVVRRLDDDRWSASMLVPAAVLIANGSFVAWSIGGLENPEYVLAITAAIAVYLRDVAAPDRWPVSGPLFFLVAISRPEGLVYTVAVGVDAAVRALATRRVGWLLRLVVGVAVPVGLYGAWHLATFGDLLPNTYYAKSRDVSLATRLFDPRANGWQYLLEGLRTWTQLPLLLVGVVALADREAWRKGVGAVLLGLVASVVFVLVSNGDWMMQYRFASPTFALLALLAGLGTATLRRSVLGGGPWLRGGIEVVAGLALAAGVGWHLQEQLEQIRTNPTVPLESRLVRLPRLMAVAEGLGLERPEILMSDMGGPMWVNDQGQAELLDMFGLCTREVAMALHHRDIDALWQFGFVDHDPAFLQFPPTLYRAWRLDACPWFQEDYAPLEDWKASRAETGFFVRRDLIEPPWEDRFATGTVVVQRPLRVHDVRLVAARPGAAEVEVLFSLREPASVSPRVRLVVTGERPHDDVVTLLPFLLPSGLAPDRVYRGQATMEVPEDVGVVTSVQVVGTPEPSDLRLPPQWSVVGTGVPDPGATALPEDMPVAYDGDAGRTPDGGVRFAPVHADDNRVCTPAVVPTEDMRLATTLSLPRVDGRLDLELRWFDARGAFVDRVRTWTWSTPFDAPREQTLVVRPLAEAAYVRACWVFRDGTGEAVFARIAWGRAVVR